MTVITLTTDFGTKDGFVGTMKGVIWGICPDAQIADISHEIPPQNIKEGAIALWRAAPFFPAGTVHIAVVDPGVGTIRRPIAMQLGSQFYVGPDNGIFTPLIEDARKFSLETRFVALDQPRFWLQHVSRTFHGRDVFAPAGAHLASGVKLDELGTPFADPVLLPLSKPALATIAIFTFQGAWQDFMGPLLYLQSEHLYTLQIGLRQFEAAAGGAPAYNWLMAASLVVMLPVLVVYLIFQRYFIEGIQLSGMGGR